VALAGEQAAAARAEYTKAAAELSAHRVAARYAQTALGRAERLLTLKAISRQDVEKARVDQEEAQSMEAQAEAEVERARATLEQLGVTDTGEMIVRAQGCRCQRAPCNCSNSAQSCSSRFPMPAAVRALSGGTSMSARARARACTS
jgi:multidrug resistance efflux pump